MYFLILTALSIFVKDLPYKVDLFNASANWLITPSEMGDPTSFVKAAMDIVNHGWITQENDWIFSLWPPGFMILEAFFIRLFGADSPLTVYLQLATCSIFSFLFTTYYFYVRKKFALSRAAFWYPLILFLFPVSRVFLLQQVGISLGETFSIAFFLSGILVLIEGLDSEKYSKPLISGIFFGLAAYFRSQFELIILGMTGWGVIFFFLLKFNILNKFVDKLNLVESLKKIFVALLLAHLIMLPWRIYHKVHLNTFMWVVTSEITFGNSVRTAEDLHKMSGGFVAEGGGNLTCELAPSTCNDFANAKKHFISTFLKYPFKWYEAKLKIIGKYWFSSVKNWGSVINPPTVVDYLLNSILLLAHIFIIVLLFLKKIRSQKNWPVLAWLSVSLYSVYFVIFTVQQFEVRYFYFPKIAGIFILLLLMPMYKIESKK